MTVDRSRGADRQAVCSTTNRIKKDGIPPGGLDTLTPERDRRSDISASPGNTPAGLGLSVCVCVCTRACFTSLKIECPLKDTTMKKTLSQNIGLAIGASVCLHFNSHQRLAEFRVVQGF